MILNGQVGLCVQNFNEKGKAITFQVVPENFLSIPAPQVVEAAASPFPAADEGLLRESITDLP